MEGPHARPLGLRGELRPRRREMGALGVDLAAPSRAGGARLLVNILVCGIGQW